MGPLAVHGKDKVFSMSLRVGIDIGSTTVKVVVLDEQNQLLFRSYERHFSKTRERALETLRSIRDMLSGQDVRSRGKTQKLKEKFQ